MLDTNFLILNLSDLNYFYQMYSCFFEMAIHEFILFDIFILINFIKLTNLHTFRF